YFLQIQDTIAVESGAGKKCIDFAFFTDQSSISSRDIFVKEVISKVSNSWDVK
ncbi:16810_t:CDS:2, partial [Gigaspora rosea]